MTETKTYRCASPTIQLTAPRDIGGANVTVFRRGEVLPWWITSENAQRLLSEGLIVEVGA
ncbi:hypothetical protein [Nocardioides sp. cx-173]|uniref:hypothetical protein n=1 Tax=Nocardioides sp. cx-173 TaxID=2898796 RepID=UPI001E33749F|nr:hypothetical protein [Nocardioides sp. cx-173]MCD4525236.1 hypothetical protein [Nocardioides sp. cx-173]UGB40961.1 hypothetical protein LQ940_16485 [Nocardioides sp. cx-173]